jgi:transcriptional regulator with XRE-family HTH domain
MIGLYTSPLFNSILPERIGYVIQQRRKLLGLTQEQLAGRSWAMTFEKIINERFSEFKTDELIEFEETQDKQLQKEAKEYLDELERMIKKTVTSAGFKPATS